MPFSADRRGTTWPAPSSGSGSPRSCSSTSLWQRRHLPLQRRATPSGGSSGGSSCQEETSTLQAARPDLPWRRTSMSRAMAGGGA